MKWKLALAVVGITISVLVISGNFRAFARSEYRQGGQVPLPGVTVTRQAVQTSTTAATVTRQANVQVQKEERQGNLYDHMFERQRGWLDEARKSGQVSPEEAKAWEEHFASMRDFHKKNGQGMMNGGMMGGYGQMNR